MNGSDQPGPLPPELRRAIPRPVRLTVTGKVVLVAALISVPEALVLGAWLYQSARSSQGRAEERRRSAVITDGIVTAARGGAGGSRRRVEYGFSVNGRPYRGSFRVHADRTRRYEPGSPLKVAYLPADPAVNWPAHQQPAALPLWIGPVAAACILTVGAGLLAWLRSQRRLLEEGRAAVGAVTRVEPIRGRSAGYRIHYEFRLLSGATRTGHFDVARNPLRPAHPVVVLYDPDEPRRQRPYPFPLVRVATD